MSAGSRSGVNCTRRNSARMAPARVRTARVLARPGTPSIKIWPRHKSPTKSRSVNPERSTSTVAMYGMLACAAEALEITGRLALMEKK